MVNHAVGVLAPTFDIYHSFPRFCRTSIVEATWSNCRPQVCFDSLPLRRRAPVNVKLLTYTSLIFSPFEEFCAWVCLKFHGVSRWHPLWSSQVYTWHWFISSLFSGLNSRPTVGLKPGPLCRLLRAIYGSDLKSNLRYADSMPTRHISSFCIFVVHVMSPFEVGLNRSMHSSSYYRLLQSCAVVSRNVLTASGDIGVESPVHYP